MAHEITRADRMVLAVEPGWHGLGTVLPRRATVEEALTLGGQRFEVVQVPLVGKRSDLVADETGMPCPRVTEVPIPSHVANLRDDTGAVLGVVGAGWKPFQNRDLAALMMDAAGSERIEIETAGTLRGGRIVFMLARLGSFVLGARDKTFTYALLANGHDGSMALTATPTNVRVVCANTLRASLSKSEAAKLTVSLRHTERLGDRLDDLRACLRGARAMAAREEAKAHALASHRLTPADREAFFADVYTSLYGPVEAKPETVGGKAKRTRAVETVAEWEKTFAAEAEYLGSEPSLWLAANAVTRWADHSRGSRSPDRVFSNLFGGSADVKAKTFAKAEEVLAGA